MSRKKNGLESFGKDVIAFVYDDALSYLKRVLEGKMRGKDCIELTELYKALDDRSAATARRFMVEAVSFTFARCLHFFDERDLPLYYRDANGELSDMNSLSDGLAAEPYEKNGWIEKYSNFKGSDPLK